MIKSYLLAKKLYSRFFLIILLLSFVQLSAQTTTKNLCGTDKDGYKRDLGKLTTTVLGNGDVKVTLEVSKSFNDNTYANKKDKNRSKYMIGWPSFNHDFNKLKNSDHAVFSVVDKSGKKVLNLSIDYLDDGQNTASGYAARLESGDANLIYDVNSSFSRNLNKYSDKISILKEHSPETDNNYSQNSEYPEWEYAMIYEFTCRSTAFGSSGFGGVLVEDMHNSNHKLNHEDSWKPDYCDDEGDPKNACVGDFVWLDANKNGIQDNNESGHKDVTVKLYMVASPNDILKGTKVTGNNGAYEFSGLSTGTYYLEFTAEAGYHFTIKDALNNSSDNKDSDVNVTTGRTNNFSLTSGTNCDIKWDAGVVQNDPIPGKLGNKVWLDQDEDGEQDGSESGVSGVVVKLFNCNNNFISETTTDANGIYLFDNLTPAEYYVQFILPSGYVFTSQDASGVSDALDSDANSEGKTICTVITDGEEDLSWDAGIKIPPTEVETIVKQLCAMDKNAVQQSVGKLTTIKYSNGNVKVIFETLKTFNDNTYSDNKDPQYVIGWPANNHTFNHLKGSDKAQFRIKNGNSSEVLNFIIDYIEADNTTASGYAAKITSGASPFILNFNTSFSKNLNAYPSNISTWEKHSPATDANYSANNSYPDWIYDMVYEFTISAGAFGSNGFGAAEVVEMHNSPSKMNFDNAVVPYYCDTTPNACVGDLIWNDTDKDGIQDSGENGVANVAVKLYKVEGSNNVLIKTVNTDTNGKYGFSALATGIYYIEVVLPAGYQFTTANKDNNSNDTKDSDINPSTGKSAQFNLFSGDECNLSWDAGIYEICTNGGEIGDRVWHDTHHSSNHRVDGIQDAGEPGIDGVVVDLYLGGNKIGTKTTANGGAYKFTGLSAGTYTVKIAASNFNSGVLSDKWYSTFSNKGNDDTKDSDGNKTTHDVTVTLTDCESTADVDFGFYHTCATLTKTAEATVQYGGTITYHFKAENCGDVVLHGGFHVYDKMINPSGNNEIWNTVLEPGAVAEFDKTFTPTLDNCGIPIVNVATFIGHPVLTNYGTIPVVTGSATATVTLICEDDKCEVGNKIWNDIDKDGIQDANEIAGVDGTVIELYSCADVLVATKTTTSVGNYLFENVAAGSYYVKVILPSGYAFSPINANGDDLIDSDVDPNTGKTECFTVDPKSCGNNPVKWDVGIYQIPPPPAKLGDKVWLDSNKDGIQDNGEVGVAKVIVQLYNCSGVKLAEKETDNNGLYLFDNLVPGEYHVKFILPDGYQFTIKDVNSNGNDTQDSDVDASTGRTVCTYLESNEDDRTWDAGIHLKPAPKASLGNRVWFDKNKDGIQDGNENGVPGISVILFSCDNTEIKEVITDENGFYLFDNLNAGDYYVLFDLPSEYTFTVKDAGSNDELDSDADIVNGKTVCTTLTEGENDLSWDAGVFAPIPDLKLEKTSSVSEPAEGDQVTFTITVTNEGDGPATGVKVKDLLPGGITYLNSSASQGVYNEVTGIWSIGNINTASSVTLTITVTVDAFGGNSDFNAFSLGIAGEYNLFVLEDLTQPSADTRGKIAVGNNASLAFYSVADEWPDSHGNEDVLVVGNNLTFTSGDVFSGNVVYGNTSNLPAYQVSVRSGEVRKDYPIDFNAAGEYLRNLSTQLSQYTTNGTTTNDFGLFLVGSDPNLNVFTVTASDLSNVTSLSLTAPNGAVNLINVSGDNIEWSGGFDINGSSSPTSTGVFNTLFNFYEATTIKISNIRVLGSVLAPLANVTCSSESYGNFIAKSVTGTHQFNQGVFLGNIPGRPNIVNTAEVYEADQNDPDSTPNNGVKTEDDFDTATLKFDFDYNYDNVTDINSGNGNSNSSWTTGSTFAAGEIIWALSSDKNGNLLVGTWGGKLYRVKKSDMSYEVINAGMNSYYIWTIAVNGDVIFVGTEQGLFKSSDNGTTWVKSSLTVTDVRAVVFRGSDIYAGSWGFGIWKSSDNGNTWIDVSSGLESLAIHALAVDSNNKLYAGSYGASIAVLDNGSSWTKMDIGYAFIWSIDIDSHDNVYAGTFGGGLFRTTNHGLTWNALNNVTDKFIYSVVVGNDDAVYLSTWTNGILKYDPNINTASGIGLSGIGISSVMYDSQNSVVYAGTKNGQLLAYSTEVTGVEKTDEIPQVFRMEQNYPNPFNPSTTFEFGIAKEGKFKLQIFNILGQLVDNVAEQVFTPGVYKISYNASRLASGVYIYRLTGQNLNIVKKMMLLK